MTLPTEEGPDRGQHDEWTIRMIFSCLGRSAPGCPWQVLRDTLYPSIHTRVSKPAIYPDRERERRLGSGPTFLG
jgi:hypothetical protein